MLRPLLEFVCAVILKKKNQKKLLESGKFKKGFVCEFDHLLAGEGRRAELRENAFHQLMNLHIKCK